MTTPLTKPLKRELQIQGRPFVVTLSPDGIKLVLKGKRKGQELRWEDLVSGEAALAVALNASLKGIPQADAGARIQTTADSHRSQINESAAEAPSAVQHERATKVSNSQDGRPERKAGARRAIKAKTKRAR